MTIGERVSIEVDGKRYQGWLVLDLESNRGGAIVELDPKYGSFGETIPTIMTIGAYAPRRGKSARYMVGSHVRSQRKWTPKSPEGTYKIHKARKKGSVRVGNVWITPTETPEA